MNTSANENKLPGILVIYHKDCNDGFAAAMIYRKYLLEVIQVPEEEIEFVAAAYGDPVPFEKIGDSTNVVILDFSYPWDVMKKLFGGAISDRIVWIDHHKTSVEYIEPLKEVMFPEDVIIHSEDNSFCGAALTYRFCFNKEYNLHGLPKFIQYIQDRDLWKKELPCQEEFHAFLSNREKDFDTWQIICGYMEESPSYLDECIRTGKTILDYQKKLMQEIIDSSTEELTIDGIKGLSCNAPMQFASDIGNILAKKSGTFGAVWTLYSASLVKFSLRSIGDFDVSEIAKKFGGGGHKNAAGFTLAYGQNAELLSPAYT